MKNKIDEEYLKQLEVYLKQFRMMVISSRWFYILVMLAAIGVILLATILFSSFIPCMLDGVNETINATTEGL